MRKSIRTPVAALLLLAGLGRTSPLAAAPEDLQLFYGAPAREWVEALPVGNGRLGAMVFGGATSEHLQLNEATLWSGGPRDWNNPQARNILPQVRAAVAAGDYAAADALCRKMQGPYNESYQPMGDLHLEFPGTAEVTGYERRLDLDRAVATLHYRAGGATFTREVFSSHPDQVIAVRLACDQPGRISFRASLDSRLRHATAAAGPDTLVLRGKCPAHVAPSYLRDVKDPVRYDEGPQAEGMTFDLRIRALVEGGTVSCDGQTLEVAGADAVTLLLAAGTSFNGFDKSPGRQGRDPAVPAARDLAAAQARPYAALLARHEADHRALFRRVALDLGSSPAALRPTDERLRHFAAGEADPKLAELLFQYGRYLLIASSRPGGEPANLQGIWNDSVRPPWSSNYTLNINTEMNYWPAEVANLAECHEPLLAFIGELAVNGRKTAEVNYGAHGWVAHHNADIWRQSAPVGDYGGGSPVWANWAMGGAWLCRDLWEHYAFSGDRAYLRGQAWPLMKGAAEFCLDWLVDDGHGHLVTSPSFSPETGFIAPGGHRAFTSMGSTMDLAIIRDLFTHCVGAARVLGTDNAFAARVAAARERLLPPRVGARGQLEEWFQDFVEEDVHHRHTSHLFGVYPGNEITPATPELFAAARRSLELRGDESTGWALGWRINLWARFRDGDHAYKLVRNLLHPAEGTAVSVTGGSGVYPNLFDAHPPFQIDGNFAFTAGICEMLVQSQSGVIDLLPALPHAWPAGHVSGLRARGGFEIAEMDWANGRVERLAILSTLGGPCALRIGSRTMTMMTKPGQVINWWDIYDANPLPARTR